MQNTLITFNLIGNSPYSVISYYAKGSNTITFTMQSSMLTITAAKDSVICSNQFTVTISVNSKTNYVVYLESANLNEINQTLQES